MIAQISKAIDYFKELILDQVNANFWVAGGVLRDYFLYKCIQPSTDVDLFFPDEKERNKVMKFLEKQGYVKIYETDNALKMSKDGLVFDLVKIYYPDPKSTICSFDFTCCCCSIDRHGIYHHETFFIDLASKSIVIRNNDNAISSLCRIKKYIAKGFNIDNDELKGLVDHIRKMPEKEYSEAMGTIKEASRPVRRDRLALQERNFQIQEMPPYPAARSNVNVLNNRLNEESLEDVPNIDRTFNLSSPLNPDEMSVSIRLTPEQSSLIRNGMTPNISVDFTGSISGLTGTQG